MASVEQAIAAFERNIEAQTGLSVTAWVERLRAAGLERHGHMVVWLKAEHGLTIVQTSFVMQSVGPIWCWT